MSAGAWAYSNSSQLKVLVRESVKATVQDEYGVVNSRTLTFDAIQQGVSEYHFFKIQIPLFQCDSKLTQKSKV